MIRLILFDGYTCMQFKPSLNIYKLNIEHYLKVFEAHAFLFRLFHIQTGTSIYFFYLWKSIFINLISKYSLQVFPKILCSFNGVKVLIQNNKFK